jgi:hypothetical protein
MVFEQGVDTIVLSNYHSITQSRSYSVKAGTVQCPDVPSENDVRSGVSFDNAQSVGNMVVPAPSYVRAGVHYDSNSSVVGTRS